MVTGYAFRSIGSGLLYYGVYATAIRVTPCRVRTKELSAHPSKRQSEHFNELSADLRPPRFRHISFCFLKLLFGI